mgnify:FL=1
MNILSLFEKLITEHGSSSILRERLELLRDQFISLSDKLSLSEKKLLLSEQDKLLLNQKITSLENDISNLNGILQQKDVEINNFKKSKKPGFKWSGPSPGHTENMV